MATLLPATPAINFTRSALLVCAIATFGHGLTAHAAGPSLADAITNLNDPDYLTRENAQTMIVSGQIPQAQLEAELARKDLTPEQVARLSVAAFEAFARAPRGALGISFGGVGGDRMGGGGAVVAGIEPGFPCQGILKVGDQLVEIGGVPVVGAQEWDTIAVIRPLIISHNAGETAKVVALRDGKRIQLDVPLGNFADLRNNMLAMDELMGAWRVRLARIRPSELSPILTVKAPESGWIPTGMGAVVADEQHRVEGETGRRASIVAGGTAGSRPRAQGEDNRRAWNNINPRQIVLNNNGVLPRGQGNVFINPQVGNAPPGQVGARRADLGNINIMPAKDARAAAVALRKSAQTMMTELRIAQSNVEDQRLPISIRRAEEQRVALLREQAFMLLSQAARYDEAADKLAEKGLDAPQPKAPDVDQPDAPAEKILP